MSTIDNAAQMPAGMSAEQRIKKLAALYEEMAPELDQIRGQWALGVRLCRESGMDDATTWATLINAMAKNMGLDLDTTEGMAIAAVLADYQIQAA